MPEVTIEFEGKTYTRHNNQYWVDEQQQVVPLSVQEALDKRLAMQIPIEKYPSHKLVSLADDFKKNESYSIAAKYYKEALKKATRSERFYIFPRLTSCYRAMGAATEVVKLMTSIKKNYGLEAITPVLMTSVAAAYCDLEEYDNAKKCADRAYVMMQGNISPELQKVYARIRKNKT